MQEKILFQWQTESPHVSEGEASHVVAQTVQPALLPVDNMIHILLYELTQVCPYLMCNSLCAISISDL